MRASWTVTHRPGAGPVPRNIVTAPLHHTPAARADIPARGKVTPVFVKAAPELPPAQYCHQGTRECEHTQTFQAWGSSGRTLPPNAIGRARRAFAHRPRCALRRGGNAPHATLAASPAFWKAVDADIGVDAPPSLDNAVQISQTGGARSPDVPPNMPLPLAFRALGAAQCPAPAV